VTVTVLGILVFLLIVMIGCTVLVTVTFSKSLQRVADHADRVHDRSVTQLSGVLDRLMSKNFDEFKAYDLGERAHGEFVEPDYEERPWNVPGIFRPRVGLAGGTVEAAPQAEQEEEFDEAG
jgi:hypothetical protein